MPHRTARREALVLTKDCRWAFFVFWRHPRLKRQRGGIGCPAVAEGL
jgi:hypothetical protein